MITPDRFPGTREEEEIQLTEDAVDPTSEGAMKYVGGSFHMRDNTGVFNPRTGSGFDVNTIVVSGGDVVTSGGYVVVSGN